MGLKKTILGAVVVGTLSLVSATMASAFVLGPTIPGKWGPTALGTGATISWSIMPGGLMVDGGPTTGLGSFLPTGYMASIQSAFDAWEAAADIDFVNVIDPGVDWDAPTAYAADIRIGGHFFDGPGFELAHGFFPPLNPGTGPFPDHAGAGDIHLDLAENWKIGFGGPGYDVFQVVAHEIGHAIGLDHTGDSGSLLNTEYTEATSGPGDVPVDVEIGVQALLTLSH